MKFCKWENKNSKVLRKSAIERQPEGTLCKIKNTYKRNDNSLFPKLNCLSSHIPSLAFPVFGRISHPLHSGCQVRPRLLLPHPSIVTIHRHVLSSVTSSSVSSPSLPLLSSPWQSPLPGPLPLPPKPALPRPAPPHTLLSLSAFQPSSNLFKEILHWRPGHEESNTTDLKRRWGSACHPSSSWSCRHGAPRCYHASRLLPMNIC